MKKIYLSFLFILLFINSAYSVSGTGDASVYKVTMKKVELCEDADCNNTYTVGERDMEVDIASADAGADVGNYEPTTGIPMGKTYTHLQVTISRTFTISGSVTLTGDDCYTDGGTDAATDQMLVGKTSASAVETSMILVDADTYDREDGSGSGAHIEISYASPVYATKMTVSGDNAVLIYKLTSPYTSGMTAPRIVVEFGTRNAIGAENTTACVMWVEEPLCTISIE